MSPTVPGASDASTPGVTAEVARPVVAPIPATGPALARFRLHAGTTIIDFPLPTGISSRTWVATLWHDARTPNGWAGKPWEPGPVGRGFIPNMVELGDVIEFGAQHTLNATACWYGYLYAVRPDAILIHGPYPSPHTAHAAAQLAMVEQIHDDAASSITDPRRARGGAELSTADSPPTTPAQPPATVSVSFHGPKATVGDPVHGWLVVDSARLLAAMSRPADQLADLLRTRLPYLDGREPPLTLAALAAHHLPDDLRSPQAAGPVVAEPSEPAAASAQAAEPPTTPEGAETPSTTATPDEEAMASIPPNTPSPSLPDASL